MCGTGGPITYFSSIPFIIDGGGAVLATGIKGSFPNIPFRFDILEWTLESPLAGNLTLDLLADPFAANSFPSTSIVAAAPPTMAAVKSASSSTLTGWTTAIPAGYSLAFSVTGVATIQLVTLSLKIRRTIGL